MLNTVAASHEAQVISEINIFLILFVCFLPGLCCGQLSLRTFAGRDETSTVAHWTNFYLLPPFFSLFYYFIGWLPWAATLRCAGWLRTESGAMHAVSGCSVRLVWPAWADVGTPADGRLDALARYYTIR